MGWDEKEMGWDEKGMGMMGEWDDGGERHTAAEPMHVLASRLADHGIAFGASVSGFEAGAGDEGVGCVGAA